MHARQISVRACRYIVGVHVWSQRAELLIHCESHPSQPYEHNRYPDYMTAQRPNTCAHTPYTWAANIDWLTICLLHAYTQSISEYLSSIRNTEWYFIFPGVMLMARFQEARLSNVTKGHGRSMQECPQILHQQIIIEHVSQAMRACPIECLWHYNTPAVGICVCARGCKHTWILLVTRPRAWFRLWVARVMP